MKILIVGPSWIGDMVMSQSLYKTLKSQHPSSTIDVLAPNWCKPILDRMPEVNKAISMPLGHGEVDLYRRFQIGKALREEQYNKAYILPNSMKSALIPWFANIQSRTGWKGEMRYGLLNDLRSNKKSFQYMLERYVALAYPKHEMINSSSLGGIEILPYPILTVDTQSQANCLKKFSLKLEKPVVGLCPGAEFGPAKQWPPEHYAKIAEDMIRLGYQVWLFGSGKDKDTTNKIVSVTSEKCKKELFNLAGNTSLVEAIDLLSACSTVVSNDSGLMHIAAAVGCNVVAVYGSTSPEYTPPLAKNVEVVHTDIECRPCFKRECQYKHLKCLKELFPRQVLQSIKKLESIEL
ncbi:lipopolysaccharide heptosyltransferase II [Vibrio sp. SCSIO 43137]|uniref:lipopolysaccharide heptosyltransferase II n=1 Tax=Vibrio sp. SCSIO 43137 TaxID=3021011 RepID=UPI0023070347|nr:lipopolysaccharide heptosyltransferase II [Vibrio sp. SCSIO 43137]WCE29860.1 lipopolysaccharide heptosyltransferase II [Vibrio sp. SCSIO 43137]